MINEYLLIELVVYIVIVLAAFRVKKGKKDRHNRMYKKYKNFLYLLIFAIFIYSFALLFLASLMQTWLWILFGLNAIFILYILRSVFNQTRCWKQHRMIYYNFLLLPVIYYCSLLFGQEAINYFSLVIYVYTFVEFQFAKFDIKQTLMWD